MRSGIKITPLFFTCCIVLATSGYFYESKAPTTVSKTTLVLAADKKPKRDKLFLEKINNTADGLQAYCSVNNYNSTHCFLVDMSIPSGRQRFFIYNFKKDSIEAAGLVTHGAGSITGGEALFFSNEPGSNCTSLGKYRVGVDYFGRFGLAYKLHGLDRSNSNAFVRNVVLHAHSCVPGGEVYPSSICPSLGCPTVSPLFLQKLKQYIDAPGKPILLYIYK